MFVAVLVFMEALTETPGGEFSASQGRSFPVKYEQAKEMLHFRSSPPWPQSCSELGEEEESCFIPKPWATRASVLPDRVYPASPSR